MQHNIYCTLPILQNREPPALSTHLWLVSNALSKAGQSNQDGRLWSEITSNLTRYITARSFQKMARRFNNKNLSIPYLNCLDGVKAVPIMPQPPIEEAPDQMEVDSDRRFLEDFVKVSFSKENKEFTGVNIPNIQKLANNLSPNDKTIELYTNETSTEFHTLLLDILHKFKTALNNLTSYDEKKNKIEDTSGKDPNREKIFNTNVRKIHTYGYGLLRLSRGCAFQLHLKNIQSLLVDPLHLSDEEVDGTDEEEDEGDEKDGDGDKKGDNIEEFDGELEAIQPTFPLNGGLPTTYTAWLRLMVAHFDAVEIVVRYIRKLQCDTVSVDILVAPMTNETLLPWWELFSGHYLPNMDSGNNARDIPSQDVIRDFLEEGISRAGAVKKELRLAEIACKQWLPVNHPHHLQVKEALEKIPQDSNIQPQVHAILTKISEWQSILQSSKNKNRVSLSRDILSMIKGLKTDLQKQYHSDRFFLKLETMSFTGTIHCEACLASLLPSFTQHFLSDSNKYKEMNVLSELQV